MSLVGARERERLADELRRHYLEGRLSADELAERLALALRARTQSDLYLAARSLPGHALWEEVLRPPARAVGRAAVLLALVCAWGVVSVVFLLAFFVAVVVHGATAATLAGFPLAWALMTWVLWRLWHLGRRSA